MTRFRLAVVCVLSSTALVACKPGQEPEEAAAETETVTETAVVEQTPEPKVSVTEAGVVSLDATVTAVDQESRKVTLEGPEGNSVTLTVSEAVQNLPQVEVGDTVTVGYLEAVNIQVVGPDQATVGLTTDEAGQTAAPGEKPAGALVSAVTVVAVIKAIDREQEEATLEGPEGNTKTVKVRNPESLDKVSVGDKVVISYTEGLAVEVTETPSAE